ncbi:Clp protease N-terminal domain-containing protein [Dactylosporangium sp. AC04546]|uniref:Clp protease N-terminal domain-containing protein n=1 Tax=Dactylosporangium sp. AC04546 TaxID=2862460 RepID=UPI001EDF158D|nr:Clp protease N-terminal domain-containing protein [Dactylosporangium sp. AC04546]WVK78309.1 Clp protease N-terminal domain-containing protein [Dactylosporangium sp. AC04546]
MFERFAPAARYAVVQAQQAAADLGHDRIGTGHLLLGLLADPDARLTWLFGQAGVTRAAVLARAAGFGEPVSGTTQGPPFTPRMRTVLELTLREALRLGHHQVTPEHLLFALAREGGGAAVRTLTALGVPPAALAAGVGELVTGPVTTVVRGSGPPPAKEPTLVVDVGTSASSAALVGADGTVRLLQEPLSGLYAWPSAVCRDGDALLGGSAANGRRPAVPAAYRAEFKRDLGAAPPVPPGERDPRPEDLVAAHLRDTGGPGLAAALTPPGLTGDAALRVRLDVADVVRGLKHRLSGAEQVEARLSPAAPPVVPPLPGGAGVLLRWLVDADTRYRGGTPMAVVRCDDGSVRRLTAPAAGGMVVAHQAAPGTRIASGDWLTTVALTPSPPH